MSGIASYLRSVLRLAVAALQVSRLPGAGLDDPDVRDRGGPALWRMTSDDFRSAARPLRTGRTRAAAAGRVPSNRARPRGWAAPSGRSTYPQRPTRRGGSLSRQDRSRPARAAHENECGRSDSLSSWRKVACSRLAAHTTLGWPAPQNLTGVGVRKIQRPLAAQRKVMPTPNLKSGLRSAPTLNSKKNPRRFSSPPTKLNPGSASSPGPSNW